MTRLRGCTRYPWEPLGRLLSVVMVNGEAIGHREQTAATRLGVDTRQVRRWKQGGLSRERAERMAERAGYVPYEVWPEILYDVDPEILKQCEGCEVAFVVERPSAHRRFCSEPCRRRTSARRLGQVADHSPRRCKSCQANYTPLCSTAKYCSARCRNRETARRYRATSNGAERARVAARKYYDEARPYVLARQRRYDRARRAKQRQAA